MLKRAEARKKRHYRIRKKLRGSAEKPRLIVRRTLQNLYVQVINDDNSTTLYATSTGAKDVKSVISYGGNVAASKALAKTCSQGLKEKNIQTIVFDRGGFLFHGRVKAFADGLREAGIKF